MIDIVLDEELNSSPVHLKVMGIGGAGGNAVNGMIAAGDLQEVQFVVSYTDSQALSISSAQT
jgi:cell division protein FtsZ